LFGDDIVIQNSRFTDGSFPVWYGSDDEECSRRETIFHLVNQAKIDLKGCEKEHVIDFQRAMCRARVGPASVKNMIPLYVTHSTLLFEDPPYPFTSRLGKMAYLDESRGISYKSKRNDGFLCIALFRKDDIHESKVINFFNVQIGSDGVKSICGEQADV